MKKTLLFLLAALGSSLTYAQNDVTFRVDMSNYTGSYTSVEVSGTFNGWCGGCAPMTDVGNGVYELTVANVPTGDIEFKFNLDNWSAQEQFTGNESCVISINNGEFINRLESISSTTTLPTYCFNQCSDCSVPAQTARVLFKVDMNDYTGSFTDVNLEGTFNSFCGGCADMTDDNNDGIYEMLLPVNTDTVEYKFAVDNFADQEQLSENDSCVKVTIDGANTFVNRLIVPQGDMELDPVCWGYCADCATVSVEEVENLSTDIRVSPNPSHGEVLLLGEFLTAEARTLNVYDLSGRVVLSRTLGGKVLNEQFNLNPFGLGVYLISIEGSNESFTRKVVVVE